MCVCVCVCVCLESQIFNSVVDRKIYAVPFTFSRTLYRIREIRIV